LVGLCWTAVLSRLGLINCTFALYQFLELELFEYFKSTRTLVNPSQVYMFRRTVFNDQKFKNSNQRRITMSKYYDAQPREGRLCKILF
jgi:hypothetical protein